MRLPAVSDPVERRTRKELYAEAAAAFGPAIERLARRGSLQSTINPTTRHVERGWRYFLPFAPALFLVVVGSAAENRTAAQVVLLAALAVLLFVGCAWVNARSVRRLEKEITFLENF